MWLCAHVYMCLQKSVAFNSPSAGVLGSYEISNTDAGNKTGFSAKTVHDLNHRAITPAPENIYY